MHVVSQVWNEDDAEDEVLAMVVRSGLRLVLVPDCVKSHAQLCTMLCT